MSNIARPFIPWVGGKEKLVPYVRQVFPDNVSQYRDICYPCSKAAKNTFYAAVLRAYDLALQAKQEEVANKLSSPRMGM